MCEHVSLNNIIRMRTLIVSLLLLVLLLDIFAVGDEIDRTFHLFKKKKEKVKDKLKKDKDKKPSYKPVIARTFRKKNKNKDKKKPKPSYKPSYHPPAVPSYSPPSYHGILSTQYTLYRSLINFALSPQLRRVPRPRALPHQRVQTLRVLSGGASPRLAPAPAIWTNRISQQFPILIILYLCEIQ